MAVEIDDEGEDQCCNHTDTDQLVLKDTGKPGDETELVQVVGHDDDAANPDQRVPGLLFASDIGPFEYPAHEQNTEAHEGNEG